MSTFLSFLAAQRNGILLLLLILIVLGFLLNSVLWMFRLGRYRGTSPQTESKLLFVLADFFVKLINDFRHLLALVIVLLFAMALFLAIWPGVRSENIDEIKEGVQAVAAALGGLIGSIIGYYFGESAASRSQPPATNQPAPVGAPVLPDSPDATVQRPPPPPHIEGT